MRLKDCVDEIKKDVVLYEFDHANSVDPTQLGRYHSGKEIPAEYLDREIAYYSENFSRVYIELEMR